MREIKFRAWDKKQIDIYGTGMSYGEPEYFDDMLAFRFNHFESDNPDDIVYEQFTGLRDRNGKEIYEGDIVRFVKPSCYPDFYEFNLPVTHQALAGFHPYFQGLGQERDWMPSLSEVLGNIHENPELLSRDV